MKTVALEGKKKREILCPPPFVAPPFGASPFGPYLLSSQNSTSKNWPKSKLAEVEIGRSRNWPKSKLAEVEIGRSRNWRKSKLAEVEIGRSRNWPKSKLAEVDRAPTGHTLRQTAQNFALFCWWFLLRPGITKMLQEHLSSNRKNSVKPVQRSDKSRNPSIFQKLSMRFFCLTSKFV